MPFIKPVLKRIRERGEATRIHQIELAPEPHGKLSYPDAIKEKLFAAMYQSFHPWHEKAFIYMCMERAGMWEGIFGRCYRGNKEFEKGFGNNVMQKVLSARINES